MKKGYLLLFTAILLTSKFISTLGEGFNEESHPHYDYIQIFKSIPTLFEYLLYTLEERPEILEKNDVTIFNRNIKIFADPQQPETSDEEKTRDKRDVECKDDDNSQNNPNSDDKECINKREIKRSSQEQTTIAYEYGNSNVVMNAYEPTDKFNEGPNIDNIASIDQIAKGGKLQMNPGKVIGADTVNVASNLGRADLPQDYGKPFFGFESLFPLDIKPEEIEEHILMTEKLLEDYNSKAE